MPETTNVLRLLLIEKDPAFRSSLLNMLKLPGSPGVHIKTTDRLAEAHTWLKVHPMDVVLLDTDFGGTGISKSIANIQKEAPSSVIILLTDRTHKPEILEAITGGEEACLVKGEFDSRLLHQTIRYNMERQKNIRDLQLSNERFRLIFNRNPYPTWVYDAHTLRFLEVNETAILKYGYTRDEFLTMTGKEIRPKEDVKMFLREIKKVVEENKTGRLSWMHLKKNGEKMFVEITTYPIAFEGRPCIITIVNDITEAVLLKEKIEAIEKKRQQELIETVIRTEEKERSYIGNELHDNVNQILASAKLHFEYAVRAERFGFDQYARGIELITLATEEIRKLSRNLVTLDFKERGLMSAIHELVEIFSVAKDMRIVISNRHFNEDLLSEGLKLTLYRIVQEQMNNVLKHSRATKVHITLGMNESRISLVISDNGRGFDINKKTKGIGLSNISQRVDFYAGRMQVLSQPGQGCRLIVSLDYNQGEDAGPAMHLNKAFSYLKKIDYLQP